MLTAGLDFGNGLFKGYSADNVLSTIRVLFRDTIGEFRTNGGTGKIADLGRNTHYISTRAGDFIVGDHAEFQSRMVLRTRDDSRLITPSFVLPMALTGLGLMAQKSGETDFQIVTGLTLGHFNAQREKVRDILHGRHHFDLNGKSYDLNVTCHKRAVVRCTYAPIAEYVRLDELGWDTTRLFARYLVIDVGFGTTDFTVVGIEGDDTPTFDQKSVSKRNAWSTVLEFISDKLMRNDGAGEIGLDRIDNAVRSRQDIGRFDIRKYLDEGVDLLTSNIVSTLTDLYSNGSDIDVIILTGGCVGVINDSLKCKYPHHRWYIPGDPLFATAMGYYLLAKHEVYA